MEGIKPSKDFLNIRDYAKTEKTPIAIYLKYATTDHFINKGIKDPNKKIILYKWETWDAWGHPQLVESLIKANKYLRKLIGNDYCLLVYDAMRPITVQQTMWNWAVNKYGDNAGSWVANPANGGGLHCYGLAVDVTICKIKKTDKNNKYFVTKYEVVNMGSDFDQFDYKSRTDIEESMIPVYESSKANKNQITREAFQWRRLLRKVMREAGFEKINSEWWHFDFVTKKYAQNNKFPIIESYKRENGIPKFTWK